MAFSSPSSKEKTVKNIISVLDSDNYSIDKTILYCNYNGLNYISFGNILDSYRDYFNQYLVETSLSKKFYYQPAAFAENYYGTASLDFLVLYFANITSLFDFNVPKIKVLPKSKLIEINKLFTQFKITVEDSYKNPVSYIEESPYK